MSLVLNLTKNDEFNVGYRRFRIVAVHHPIGCEVIELGAGTFRIGFDTPVHVGARVTLQEGIRKHNRRTQLKISAPDGLRIWRGRYDYDVPVALLAPVPEEHLLSGRQMCADVGRVAYGSRDFQVFRRLDEYCEGAPCQVLIYASASANPQLRDFKVTWTATYLRTVDARPDGSSPKGIYRPESTARYPGDQKGHWAVYWEVTDLNLLEKDDRLLISLLRGKKAKSNYSKAFRPEGPLIIEAL